jgi:hypothetical protein
MCRPNFLHRVVILAGSLLLVGLLLPVEQLAHTALAQELPPRPTLTPAEDDDDDEGEPTPVATITASATVALTMTPTPAPPTPVGLPVTGGQAGGGGVWITLAIGLLVCAIGLRRAL